MYAIETYYISPTNARGARIKARVMEGRTAACERTHDTLFRAQEAG